MPIYQYKEFVPKIGKDCFIAPSADVIGKVEIGDNTSIWYRTVVRGDVNRIIIGHDTNVQDLTMLHVIDELPLIIGNYVSIGHHAMLHACTVEDNCLIGMSAVVLDGAVIGRNSLVAAGSVVPPRKQYPPNSFIMGSPAKVVRELTEQERQMYGNHYQKYLAVKKDYLDSNLYKLIKA